jgi:hypothetical protein
LQKQITRRETLKRLFQNWTETSSRRPTKNGNCALAQAAGTLLGGQWRGIASMTRAGLMLTAALVLMGCAGPDYHTYNPVTVDLGEHGERQAIRQADLDYCRTKVDHFHHPVSLADAAGGAGRGAESGLGVALVYPPAVGIGGGVGLVTVLTGASEKERDVKMLVNCLTGEGIKHGYVVMDASR